MAELKELFQGADWKKEKHVPVIEAPAKAAKGQMVQVAISVGKEISHPNTTAHHIRWIEVYFLPSGEKFPYQLGRFEFNAHGASTQGADTSTIMTHPQAAMAFKTDKGGTLLASSYCNIHGLWQSSAELTIE
jgi:superoxide reductase